MKIGPAMLLSAALLAGCAHRPPNGLATATSVAWPPPPDRARIELVRTVEVPGDLGIRSAWLRRVVRRLLHGKRVQTMARPYAVAAGPGDVIAVADPDARSVHLFDIGGNRYRRIMKAGGEMLASPVGVAFDSDGSLFVSDSSRAAVFRIDHRGEDSTVLEPGVLRRPTGLAMDRDRGVLYVVDTAGHRVVGYDRGGKMVFEAGGRGTGDGEFNYPVAVAVDGDGRILVTDSMNFRVQILDPAGRHLRSFGRQGRSPGDFDKTKGIAVDGDGHIYVVEGLHDVVQVYDKEGRLLTVLGGTGSGPGRFLLPAGIHIDGSDRILIADSANHRVQILRYLGEGPEEQEPS